MQTATRLTEFLVLAFAMAEIENGRKVWDYFSFWEQKIDATAPRLDTDGNDLHAVAEAVDAEPSGLDNNSGAQNAEAEAVEDDSDAEDTLLIRTGGTPIKVYHDEDKDGESAFKILGRGKHRDTTTWMSEVVDFLLELQDLLKDHLIDEHLMICTAHQRGTDIFYGHPNYRGEGPWKDWALVDWGQEGVLPCHIWCFVVLPELPSGSNSLEYGGIRLKKGVYAVTECAQYDETAANESDLFVPLQLITEGLDEDGEVIGRSFFLSDTDAIVAPCCVVPDIGGQTNAYFQVKNRNQWAKEFIDWLEQPHRDDYMDWTDEDEE